MGLSKAALRLVLGLALSASSVKAEFEYVVVASSANITRCLGVRHLALTLKDCLEEIGAEWNWTKPTPPGGQQLRLVTSFAKFAGLSNGLEEQCLDRDLTFRPCSSVATAWFRDETTLQLFTWLEGERWCLGLTGLEPLLTECTLQRGTTSDVQNGIGVPPSQSWVYVPTDRPQIRVLDRIQFPLSTSGRHIIDSEGRRVKLVGVNWFGAEMEMMVNNGLGVARLRTIAKTIKFMGFNMVKLHYAEAMFRMDAEGHRPVPNQDLIKANPELAGLTALQVFDKTIQALTDEGLLVIVTRSRRNPGWCCSGTDGEELWYGRKYNTEDWLAGLTFIAGRYSKNPRVIGYDIFDKPRMKDSDRVAPWWGIESSWTKLFGVTFADWRVAAAQGAVATWQGSPTALVLIQGVFYGTDLQHVPNRSPKFAQSCLNSRVVYSTQEYLRFWFLSDFFARLRDSFEPWSFAGELADTVQRAVHNQAESESGDLASVTSNKGPFNLESHELLSYEQWLATRRVNAYYLVEEEQAALFVGEFGTARKANNAYWQYTLTYFKERDLNWAYSTLDPLMVPSGFEGSSIGQGGQQDTFGLFDSGRPDYSAVVGWKLQDLISIQAPSPALPDFLPRPQSCTFDAESNVRSAAQSSGPWEVLMTMSWPAKATAQLFFIYGLLFTPFVCCCLFGVCDSKMMLKAAAKTPDYMQVHAPLHSGFLDSRGNFQWPHPPRGNA